jgi:hypothetical protein
MAPSSFPKARDRSQKVCSEMTLLTGHRPLSRPVHSYQLIRHIGHTGNSVMNSPCEPGEVRVKRTKYDTGMVFSSLLVEEQEMTAVVRQ